MTKTFDVTWIVDFFTSTTFFLLIGAFAAWTFSGKIEKLNERLKVLEAIVWEDRNLEVILKDAGLEAKE